jgi:ubiquinone/menaquinone biosynthesis C-methylase UbiE
VSWDHGAGNNPGLVKVVKQVLLAAEPNSAMRCLDLGCGSGQLTIGLARQVATVHAVDISQVMIDLLLNNAATVGVTNITGEATPIERLEVVPGSLDLIVTNYALHHLKDDDKALLIQQAFRWLIPGGRLVIGDMMFGRGGDARDREIISSKLVLLLKKGPGGWWRIAKNAGRFIFRFHERPVSMAAWTTMLATAGFCDVQSIPVVNEAAVICGTKPARA